MGCKISKRERALEPDSIAGTGVSETESASFSASALEDSGARRTGNQGNGNPTLKSHLSHRALFEAGVAKGDLEQAWDTFQHMGRMGKGQKHALEALESTFDLEPDNRYVPLMLPLMGAEKRNHFALKFRMYIRGMAFLDTTDPRKVLTPEDAFPRFVWALLAGSRPASCREEMQIVDSVALKLLVERMKQVLGPSLFVPSSINDSRARRRKRRLWVSACSVWRLVVETNSPRVF